MSKSVGNIFQLSEAIDRFGARGRRRLPELRPLPPAARVLRAGAGGGRRPARADPQLPRDAPSAATGRRTRSWPSAARRSSTRSPTTSTRRAPGRRCSSWSPRATAGRSPGAREALAEMLQLLGLESLARRRGRRRPTPRPRRCWPSARGARAERDFERADEIRDELAELGWEVRDTPEGAKLVRRGLSVSRARARSSTAAGRSPRPSAGGARCAASGARRRHRCRRADAARRLARSPGDRRRGRSLPLRGRRRRCWRRPRRLVVALDQVQDPHNLGAVAARPRRRARPAS